MTGYAPSIGNSNIQTFTENLGNFDPAGLWEFTILDSANDQGIDSYVTFTVTLSWTVPATPSDCNAEVCNGFSLILDTELPGLSYSWSTNEFTQSIEVTQPGTYTVTVTDGTDIAIDEIDVIFLSSLEEVEVSLCDGDSHMVGSSTYTQAGSYEDLLTNSLGCDSLVITHITILPVQTVESNVSLCPGQSHTVGESTYTGQGTFTDVLTSSFGCDSIITTNITISSSSTTDNFVEICDGTSYPIGDSIYTVEGTYTNLFTSSGGCDSTVITYLTITTAIINEMDVTICQGESITVGNSTYNSDGDYTDMFTTDQGCDSTVITHLTVVDNILEENTHFLCSGDSIIVGNSTYFNPGTFTDFLTSVNGCDSTVVSIIFVTPEILEENEVQICDGQSIMVGGNTYSSSGEYTDVLTSYQGCDSTIITHLEVINNITFEQDIQICTGESVSVGESVYNSDGNYTDVINSVNGCDSTIITNLTVVTEILFEQEVMLCPGETIEVGNSTYSSTGTYTDLLISTGGCDSTVTTIVIEVFPVTEENDIVLCLGESWTVGDNTYIESGDFTDVLTGANGCDSTIITHLTILPQLIEEIDLQICEGQSVTIGDSIYTEAGDYQNLLESYLGCDSLVISHIEIVDNIIFEQFVEICDGDSIMVGNNSYFSTGTYTDLLVSSSGCDSTVITVLDIVTEIFTEQEFILCEGESIMVGENTYDATGTYTDFLTSNGGCDSTVVTIIEVVPSVTITQEVVLCDGDIIIVGENTYDSSGNYTDVLTSSAGCDSTVITIITTSTSGEFFNEVVICEGEEFIVGNNVYTQSGSYTDFFNTAAGCDSIVITLLEVIPTLQTTEVVPLCVGGEYNGQIYTEDTVIEEIFTSSFGCDSIHTISILMNVNIVVEVEITDDNCSAQNGIALARPFGGTAPYTFLWNNGFFLQLQDDLSAGTYTVTVTDANGCTGVGQGTVSGTEGIDVSVIAEDVACNGGESGVIDIEVLSGAAPYIYQWNSSNGLSSSTEDLDNIPAGTYDLIVIDANECEFGATVVIDEPSPLSVSILQNGFGFAQSSVSGGIPPYSYSWSNGETTASIFDDPGSYSLNVTDANGCQASADVTVIPTHEIEGLSYFQLSPNPNNGQFVIEMEIDGYLELELEIYNFLGQSVQGKRFINGNSVRESFDMSDLPKGTYFLSITDGKERLVEKIIIQ